jgi:hypothetical protein
MSKQSQELRKVKMMLILSYNSDGVKCPQQGLMGPNCECRVLSNISGELLESNNARTFSISSQVLHLMWHLKIHAVMYQDLLKTFQHNSNGKFHYNLP